MAKINDLKKIYSDKGGQAPSTGEEVAFGFNENFDAVKEAVNAAYDQLASKASSSSVSDLSDAVSQKASQSALNSLSNVVNSKADQSALVILSATVAGKLDASLAEHLVAGSIDISDGDEILDSYGNGNPGWYSLLYNEETVGHLLVSALSGIGSVQYRFESAGIQSRIFERLSWKPWKNFDPSIVEGSLSDHVAAPGLHVVVTAVNPDELTTAGVYSVRSGNDSYYVIVDTTLDKQMSGTINQLRIKETVSIRTGTSVLGDPPVWSSWKNLSDLASVKGGTINVTANYPLSAGQFYTLSTAISAVESEKRGLGSVVTFSESVGKWVSYQFTGTTLDAVAWENADLWTPYGSGGSVKKIRFNGEDVDPDEDGVVALQVNETEIDESLDPESTNPVENRVIAGKLQELESGTLFSSDVEIDEETQEATVRLLNKSNAEITSFTLPAGGGGGGETASTKIVLTSGVDNPVLKEGGNALLTYFYDHVNVGGDDAGLSTGQKATITIQVRRGSTESYSATMQEVNSGSFQLDLSAYLLVGTNDVYVIAETLDPLTGKTQKKQAYVSVRVVTLSLSSGYSPSSNLSAGGYEPTATASIPYAVNGSGTKIVTLYLDGVQRDAHTVTRSGTTNSSFDIPLSGLPSGRHTVQLVAEMEADAGFVLKSESIYIDLLVAGGNAPYVGLMIVHPDGRIFDQNAHLTPTVEVGQYEACEFKFAVYNPSATPASLSIFRNDALMQTVSVPRTTQTYQNRFTEQGRQTMQFQVGSTTSTLYVDVVDSGIDISEATYGLLVKLDPSGRSNSESNPAKWESGGVSTLFEGFDWNSSGWTGHSLKLSNGAKAIIGYELFRTDAGATGATIEMEFKVSNVLDRTAEVIRCMDEGKGLSITAEEASIKTGTILHYTNEDGEDASREVKIGTKFAPDKWLKVAFVIGRRSEGRLMELYVNGNRAGADIYDNSYYFQQDNPQGVTIDSNLADVEMRNIRIYNRALSDDEVLENRMVDAEDIDDMMRLYEENDILSLSSDVDIDKLRAKGKGVMRIVRRGGLDELNETNNKNTDFLADIYFYSPFGKEYDFVLHDCYIRIQGTSSTKYPSKNTRIYCAKGGTNLSLIVGGKEVPGKTYSLQPGAIPMNLFCLKSDYSDSSMTTNTGGAKLFNDVMLELGLLTPPQRFQYDQSGGNLNAVNIRSAIGGFPIDVFSSETVDGESLYFGQYNFNNEKSKSGKLFGMEGLSGYTPACPLTLETLNNGEKTCLFQSDSDADLIANFDAGLETNYPDDVKWAGLDATQQNALKRLFAWIRSCVPSGADANDLDTFSSLKFKNEVSQYFDVDHLLSYYLHTDYFAAVDQRAKNILVRTWDGLIWYLTYYDGDTQLGKRNDCFLVYEYTVDRNTWDAEAGKYAFEGRESWLWNLVLANLQDDLKRCAANYRSKMTVDRALTMFDVEQMGNWSDRAYNKSGYLKYIRPAMIETYGKKWPFIYALQGNNASHRNYFIRNRFALLDAKYGTSNFTSDNVDLYLSRSSGDAPDTVQITANETYVFGYGTNNSPNLANTGIVDGGVTVSLQIAGAYTVNDPLRIYGASRMRALDMTGAANRLKNGFDLGKCTVLRELNMQTAGAGSTGWWLSLGSCRQLRKINLRNQAQAKTGGSTSTELDFSAQTRLEELDARGTQVQSVTFAKGAPLQIAYLPGTLTVLKLEYLNRLTSENLSLESYSNVKTLIVDGCPSLDWESLLDRCPSVDRLRVTGIDRKGDAAWLSKFDGFGGVDAEGNATSTCSLVGTYQLTQYIDDTLFAAYRSRFPELNIYQPEYTVLVKNVVGDPANISNLDNKTGYRYGNAYAPSGHVQKILSMRFRCLGKRTANGEVTIYPLHNENSNYYADSVDIHSASPAVLTGAEGDVYMFEPRYWYKGVNDIRNGEFYDVYSSNESVKTPEGKRILLSDLIPVSGYGLRVTQSTLESARQASSTLSYYVAELDGYRRVRVPSVASAVYGALFLDASDNVLSSIYGSSDHGMINNGYLLSDVPEGAVRVAVTISNVHESDFIWLTNSDDIADMEPDWVEHKNCLGGVFEATVKDDLVRSIVTSSQSTGSVSQSAFRTYARNAGSGFHLVDWELHKDVANLFYARYGNRDSQETCGYGTNSYTRPPGLTAQIGMQDTFSNPDNPQEQSAYAFVNGVMQNLTSPNVLGYENWHGNKWEFMDNVAFNVGSVNYRWSITMPDGTVRVVQGLALANEQYPVAMVHGRYMDIIVAQNGGSTTTHYCDYQYLGAATNRVVGRSNYNAYAQGGVSYANANHDSAYVYAHYGSRLAFRGKIVRAQSVSAFKSIIS